MSNNIEVKMQTTDKKLYCYTIKANKSLDSIFTQIKDKVQDEYSNLEKRGLVYDSVGDECKYFLDVKDKKAYECYNGDSLNIFKCIYYKFRGKDFPYLFDLATGKKSTITDNLTDVLMEQTHFIVIPDINLIISEYNYYGANVNKLNLIIQKVLGVEYTHGLEIKHVIDSNTAYKIRNLETIDKLQFKAGHQGLETISKYFKIGGLDAMTGTFDNAKDLEFEITIKGKGRGKNKSNFKLTDMGCFKKLYDRIHSSEKAETLDISKAKIVDSKSTTCLPIDLFEEYLVAEVTAVKLSKRSKYIDSIDMFEKILKVYNHNKFELSNYKKIKI